MQNIASNIHFILRSYDNPSTNHALGIPVAMHWGFHLDCVSQKVTKSDQIWGIQKTRLCKVFENQQLTKSICASGGTRTRTAVSGQGIFLPLWLSPPVSVCGPDYSFTVDSGSLGVSCLVSAPSSFRRLGSRLPSA